VQSGRASQLNTFDSIVEYNDGLMYADDAFRIFPGELYGFPVIAFIGHYIYHKKTIINYNI
jgi:hypothetical protein